MRAVEQMKPHEQMHALALADDVAKAMTEIMADSDRSEWTKGHRIGVSDIGHCREYLRRIIKQEPFSDEQDDYSAAFMGTAVGALAEEAMLRRHPEAETQLTVAVRLEIGDYVLTIPGHPDLLLGNTLVDFKTVDGLGVIRRVGPSQQQKYQITLYAKSLIDIGRLPQDCTLSLCYIDRSGREQQPVVFSWTYDPDVLAEAMAWLGDVIYAVQHDEEASRDKPRDWCFQCCPFATDCRGTDTDVEGVIDDPLVIEAKRVYLEAVAEMNRLEKDKKSALSVLKDRSGVIEDYVLRWIDIPGGSYEVNRAPYRRINLKPVDRAANKARKKQQQEPTS